MNVFETAVWATKFIRIGIKINLKIYKYSAYGTKFLGVYIGALLFMEKAYWLYTQ